MNAINGGSRTVFRNWLSGGAGGTGKSRKLQVLLMKHEALERSLINFGPVCCVSHDRVVADVKDALGRWKSWGAECGFGIDRLDIRATDWIMAFSGVAIDMDGPDGLIQAEFYSYNTPDHLAARPNLIVRVGSAYWDPLRTSVAELFDSGTPA
jgi:hypothetical protein